MSFRRLMSIGVLAASAAVLPALPGQAAPNTGKCDGSYPPGAPSVSIQVSAHTLTAGQSVTAFGVLRKNQCAIRDARVQIQRRRVVNGSATGGWTLVRTVTTGNSGLYGGSTAPLHNEQLRAVFNGGGGFVATHSAGAAVNVRTAISAAAGKGAGCKITVRGATRPAKPGTPVTIQRRGPRGHFHGWKLVGYTLTNGTGHYSLTQKFTCGRTYNLAAVIGDDSTNLSGQSPTVYGVKATQ
jgi:hypothetical protein